MSVSLHVPGATPKQLERGVAAALSVFSANGIQPEGAAIGEYARRLFDLRGFEGPEPGEEALRAASIFDLAEASAFEACGVDATGRHLSVDGFDTPRWQAVMNSMAIFKDESDRAR